MEFHHDVHLVAHRFADFAEWLQRGVQLLRRNVEAVGALGRNIERPDFHAGNALFQQ